MQTLTLRYRDLFVLLLPLIPSCNSAPPDGASSDAPARQNPTLDAGRTSVSSMVTSSDEPNQESANADPNAEPDPPSTSSTEQGIESEVFVKIGIPDLLSGLAYADLPPGGEIQLQDGTQGSSHAVVAIQASGLGDEQITLQVGVRHPQTGDEAIGAGPLTKPCGPFSDLCEIVPIFARLDGVAPREAWEGLDVELWVTVQTDGGVAATGTATGRLLRR